MTEMTKKKWIIIGVVVVAVITSLAIAIPIFATNADATPSPTQFTTLMFIHARIESG